MNILIETPTWLGDCVMATPAIENIIKAHPNAKLTIFGSRVSVAIFKHNPNVKKIIIDDSRAATIRFMRLAKLAKSAGNFDAVFSFRRRFFSRFFVFLTHAKSKYNYQRFDKNTKHQVLRYNEFVNKSLNIKLQANPLKIYLTPKPKPEKPLLGINPGASYGSAKRWYPAEFAKVAGALSNQYDIVIFGSKAEVDIANDIEAKLINEGVQNYQNLAGKTDINELIEKIAQLSLFITGDSGPMHLAAAFAVPSVAIFGPTKDDETCAWMHKKSIIIKQNLDCQPCMQRVCPLKGEAHHQCMKSIDAQRVLTAVNDLF